MGENVVPVAPQVLKNVRWIGLALLVKLLLAMRAHAYPRLRKLLITSTFTIASALVWIQAKESSTLRNSIQNRLESSEQKACERGKCMFDQNFNFPLARNGAILQMTMDWLTQKFAGGVVYATTRQRVQVAVPSTTANLPAVSSSASVPKVCSSGSTGTRVNGAASADGDPVVDKMEAAFAHKDHTAVLAAAEYNIQDAAFLPTAPAQSSGVKWRVARSIYMLSYAEPLKSSKDLRSRVLLAGAKMTQDAAGADPHDGALCHKWTAILTMHNAVSIPEKVHASHYFDEHTQLALKSGRGDFDATLHFAVGKFQAGIAELGWIERRAAAAIAGKPLPTLTWENALQSFRTCVTLRPDGRAFAMDHGQIAICLDALKKKSDATEAWRACLSVPSTEPDDDEAHELARKRLGC